MSVSVRRSIAAFVAIASMLVASACTSKKEDSNKVSGTITISAAASLTEVFTQLGNDFKAANPEVSEVKFNFAASSSLATQIIEGAPADVFASADESNMAKLTDKSLIEGQPSVFARNKMTIAVMVGNPQAFEGIESLATGLMIALCNPEVPCGKLADQILANANVTIAPENITRGENVKATLRAVTSGDADAAIVYLTDAVPDGANIDIIDIPDDINETTSYPMGVVKDSTNKATAQAFIDYVMSPAGQKTLSEAGFLAPQ